MNYQNAERIFVIGFLGSDRTGTARKISRELGYEYVNLDELIEKSDGRTILRICMTMGEHEYRNKEYEHLRKLSSEKKIVVACGDGIILDDENKELLKNNAVVLADADKNVEELWQRCREKDNIPYAFMHEKDEVQKKDRFYALYESRKPLYNSFINTRKE